MIGIGLLLGMFAGALIDPGALAQSKPSGFDICSAAQSILTQTEPGELRSLADSAEAYRLKRRPDLHVKGALALYRLAQLNEDERLVKRALYFFDRAEHRYSEDACFFYYHGRVRRADGSVKPFASEAWARTVRGQNADQAMRDFRKAHELRPEWLAPVAAMVQTVTESFAGRIGRLSRWRKRTSSPSDSSSRTRRNVCSPVCSSSVNASSGSSVGSETTASLPFQRMTSASPDHGARS